MDSGVWSVWATVVGGWAALATVVGGVYQYAQQNKQKRAAHFIEMERIMETTPAFAAIRNLLENDDPALQDIDFHDKRNFLGFFELVALLVNSRLLTREVVHYMLGYYAIRCWESENFWRMRDGSSLNKDSVYWALFAQFVKQMQDAATDLDRKFNQGGSGSLVKRCWYPFRFPPWCQYRF